MRIYIAGPYTPVGKGTPQERQEETNRNITRADEAARKLVELGHPSFRTR